MELTRDFKNLNKNDVHLAGGKGASLGEMTQAGIPVPPGFVILSSAFDRFIEETDLNVEIDAALDSVNHQEIHTVENASEKIQALILNAEMPEDIAFEIENYFKKLGTKYVAVRSSATAEDSSAAAWAGQLDTFLNTIDKDLLENVKKCWASLFTPRAIFYRFEKELHKQKISVAVVVQKMVESEKSGIAFSVHPVTQDYNQLIIEAGFGLGEAIVSGQITPDSYVIEKNPRRIIDKNVQAQLRGLYRSESGTGDAWKEIEKSLGESQALSDEEIFELSETILNIEKHYGFPVDVEWAFKGGKFYIVQSRPITTLKGQNEEIKDLDQFTKGDVSIEHYDGCPAFVEMTGAGFSTALYKSTFPPYRICASFFKERQGDFLTLISNQQEIGKIVVKNYIENEKSLIGLYQKWLENFQLMWGFYYDAFKKDLENLSDGELITWSDKLSDFYKNKVSMPGFIDGFMFYADKRLDSLLREFSEQNGIDNYQKIFVTFGVPVEPSFFNEEEADIKKLSDKLQASGYDGKIELRLFVQDDKALKKIISEFLLKYSYIKSSYAGYEEYTWADLEVEIKKFMESGQYKAIDFANNIKVKEDMIAKYKFNEEILAIAKISEILIKWQDQRKQYTLTFVALRQKILEEISKRTDIALELLRYCDGKEIADILNRKLGKDVLEKRQEGCIFIYKDGNTTEIVVGDDAISFFKKVGEIDLSNITEIKGIVASLGKVQGTVKIISSISDLGKINKGDILVAAMTRPEHVSGMKKASAIITDDGGITCHAAIISRELGKPCIIGTKVATKALKDGDLVEVDANNGVVRLLNKNNLDFVSKNWKKNWAGGWSMLSCHYLGYQYTKQLEEAVGESLREALMISHDGITSCYFLDEHKDKFGKHLAEQAKKNPDIVSKWSKNLKKTTDKVMSMVKKLESKEVTLKNFEACIKAMYEYGVPHRIVKVVVDYLPKDILEKYLDELSDARVYAEPVYEETEKYIRYAAKKIEEKENLKPGSVIGMTKKQLLDYFKKGALPDAAILEEQFKDSALYMNHGEEEFFKGKEIVSKIEEALLEPKGNQEIKGQSAYPGKVQGRVRIILDTSKAGEFNDGDILVTGMTRPDYLPYVERSAGFITDAGGILSHAAITARELKKPCVIGTEVATKVLKNGDLVEIDAEKGIIYVIK